MVAPARACSVPDMGRKIMLWQMSDRLRPSGSRLTGLVLENNTLGGWDVKLASLPKGRQRDCQSLHAIIG